MSSSMYEVFNWNDTTPDPPLTPAKSKRASLSLPPTTDVFSVDDALQRGASGEFLSLSFSFCHSISLLPKVRYSFCIHTIEIRLPSRGYTFYSCVFVCFWICLFMYLSIIHTLLSLFLCLCLYFLNPYISRVLNTNVRPTLSTSLSYCLYQVTNNISSDSYSKHYLAKLGLKKLIYIYFLK